MDDLWLDVPQADRAIAWARRGASSTRDRRGEARLTFENLAERTLAFAQLARRSDPAAGYEPLLDQELRPVLVDCLKLGTATVSNFGGANPRGAASKNAIGRGEGR